MNLLQHIRSQRAKQKTKQPLKRDIFNQIGGLVRGYGLGERFLTVLENVEDYLSDKNLELYRIREKVPLNPPLFFLATKDEYHLAMAFICNVDSPYLQYAHSPEEILLSRPLYRLNPSLDAEKLKNCHFETLLLYERAKGLVRELVKQQRAVREAIRETGEDERNEDKRLQLTALQERITKLQNYIAKVETIKV